MAIGCIKKIISTHTYKISAEMPVNLWAKATKANIYFFYSFYWKAEHKSVLTRRL